MKSSKTIKLTRMVILTSVLFGFSILTNGCKKDTSTSPSETSIDPKLIGTWTSDEWARIMVFKENHQFVDSVFNPSIKPANLIYVLHGYFDVRDGYILLSNVNLNYYYRSTDSTILSSLLYSYPTIKIQDLFWSKLDLVETKILTPEDPANPHSLTGKWTTNMLVSAFDREQIPKFVTGNDHREYVFSADSSWFSINHILQYGNKIMNYNFGLVPYIINTWGYTDMYGDPVVISYRNNLMYLESPPISFVKTSYQ